MRSSAAKQPFIDFWTNRGSTVKIRPKVSWAGKVDAPNLVLGDEERWPCYWAMQSMSVTDQAKVAVDLDAAWVAGDVREQSLEAIWSGPLRELRELHRQRRFHELPTICRECPDWQSARAAYFTE